MPRRSKRLQGSPAPQEQPVETTKRRRTARGVSPHPSVIIDHTAFPHIVEAIILSSSPEVLLAFRQTCHAFQALVDDCLPRSISFEPDGTVLPFARNDVCLDHIRLFDTRIWTNWPDREEAGCVDCSLSNHCSCYEWGIDAYHFAPDFPSMRPHLNNVKMVRQADNSCSTYTVRAETCVTFFDLTTSEGLKLANIPLYYYDGTGHCYGKHVRRFICSARQPLRGLQYLWDREFFPYNSGNIVIILSLADFDRGIEYGPWPCYDDPPEDSLFHHIVDMVATILFPSQERRPTVTFVDVDSWNNTWNAQEPRQTTVNMRDLVKKFLGEIFFEERTYLGDPNMVLTPEEAHAYLDNENDAGLSFATLDEYRDQVGDEQFALEMGKGWRSERGWTGKMN